MPIYVSFLCLSPLPYNHTNIPPPFRGCFSYSNRPGGLLFQGLHPSLILWGSRGCQVFTYVARALLFLLFWHVSWSLGANCRKIKTTRVRFKLEGHLFNLVKPYQIMTFPTKRKRLSWGQSCSGRWSYWKGTEGEAEEVVGDDANSSVEHIGERSWCSWWGQNQRRAWQTELRKCQRRRLQVLDT